MSALGAAALLAGARAEAGALDRVEPAGAPDAEALRGSVLVWQDAALYTDAADPAPVVRVAGAAPARKHRLGQVIAMRVLGVRGAFVEVEPIGEPGCTGARITASDDVAKLRLFVKRADLAPVVAAPFARTFADDTRLQLAPGTPVLPTGDGAYVAAIGGDEVRAELPAAAVAYSYTPERAKPAALSGQEYDLDARAAVALAGEALAPGARRAVAIERKGDAVLATIEARCAVAVVKLAAKAVREVEDDESSVGLGGSGSGGAGVLGLRDELYLPLATALVAPGGGRTIAYAAKPIYLPVAPASSAKQVCFDRRLALDGAPAAAAPADGEDRLRLCAPVAKIARDRFRGAGSANGTTKR